MPNLPSFRDDLWEIAVFFIAGGLRGYYLGVFEDGIDVSAADVVDLDEAVVEGQALGVVLIDCWQGAFFLETVVEVAGQRM
jgi:hypothetical protein